MSERRVDRKPPHPRTHRAVKAAHDALVAQQRSINGLAQTSGVARETIHRWFNGEMDPHVGNLEAVLNTLGLRIVVEPIAGDRR